MVYSYFANTSKSAAHWAIDNTFPSTPFIAAATAFAADASYRWGMTYGQSVLSGFLNDTGGCTTWGNTPGRCLLSGGAAMYTIPESMPHLAFYISIGASCATSFTLNQIAKIIFKIPKLIEKKTLSPKILPQPEVLVQITPKIKETPVLPTETPLAVNTAEIPLEKKDKDLFELSPNFLTKYCC